MAKMAVTKNYVAAGTKNTIGDIARRFNEKRGHWEMNFEII